MLQERVEHLVATVAQPSLIGEIAERLAEFQQGARFGNWRLCRNGADELSYLPTPGPGDSEGGDIY